MDVEIFLFGKPEWMIDLDKATAEDIKDLGSVIKKRLDKVSVIVEKLENNGWSRSSGLYDLFFYKYVDMENGQKELESLGIDKGLINVMDKSIGLDENVDIDKSIDINDSTDLNDNV